MQLSKCLEEFLTNRKYQSKFRSKFPEGFFERDAGTIARWLIANSVSLKQAISRVNFFVNRSGDRLTSNEKLKFDTVKAIIRQSPKFKNK